ncbi:hypothetical protein EGR_01420 [Echinococcus granulosus]|uniref:Uncharacterized protein n=1 Tax=Echinococcus granulosus TaxID=6210 RepID=W6UYR5_ECHGR|nr:hypothetical protein EGR_01420 [Echinococcus granulosus]EUB63797.1 hypothetical protein EGR_01420 [Echinococcus granulosus]
MADGSLFQFPVLNFSGLATRVAECTGQKIKPSDLAVGFKVDGIICHCLFDFYGISLSPSDRSFYALTLMKKFEQMKFPESFTSSDFAEERDPKKMSRVLSWLFRFFETLAPANEYAFNVWNSYKEKASHATALKEKIASLRIINKTEEGKRSEYQKIIVELRSSLSEKLISRRQIDDRIASEGRKLSLLTESEKSHSLEVSSFFNFFHLAPPIIALFLLVQSLFLFTNFHSVHCIYIFRLPYCRLQISQALQTSTLYKKLDELKGRREILLPQVVENPNLLPKAVEELKEKLNALELEMQEIRAKTFQVDQSIGDFKRLHEVIEQQLVTVARACHSLLYQMSQSQTDLEKSDKEIVGRSTSTESLVKKITDVTERLRLSEHNIVKAKVLEATQTLNADRIKKEKAALLDRYRFVFKSLEPDVCAKEALLKTTKILYENEYSNKKRDDDWKKIEELKDILQRLYQAYVQSQDRYFFR